MLAILEDENCKDEQNLEYEGTRKNAAYDKFHQNSMSHGNGTGTHHSKQPTGETAHFVI